jgi:uncharacterized protein YceK
MKTIFLIILAVGLSGCATREQFMQSFAASMEGQQQRASASQQTYQAFAQGQNNQAKRTDYQCVNTCASQGYQYALCTSKCSY